MPTYETQWFSVNDGGSITHNAENLVGKSITVNSAEIQWRGVSSTVDDYSTNQNSDNATTTVTEESRSNTNEDTQYSSSRSNTTDSNSGSGGSFASASYPAVPAGSDFESISVSYELSNSSLNDSYVVSVSYEDANGNSITDETTLSAGETQQYSDSQSVSRLGSDASINVTDDGGGGSDISVSVTASTTYSSYDDATASTTYPDVPFNSSFDRHEVKTFRDGSLVNSTTYTSLQSGSESITTTEPSQSVTVEITTFGTETNTDVGTASTSYPSIPSGYNFDRHRQQEFKNGSEVTDTFYSTNKVGETESVSAGNNDGDTASLTLTTRGVQQVTKDSTDPSISGDVSASYTGSISDGQTTSYQTLDGLDSTDEQFTHSVSGSSTVEYRFRFDYTVNRPTKLSELRIHDGSSSSNVSVALVDPDDAALDYSSARVHHSNTTYAIELVQRSDPDARPDLFVLQHPIHGQLCPREV